MNGTEENDKKIFLTGLIMGAVCGILVTINIFMFFD